MYRYKEFRYRIKNDGLILIKSKVILKIKPTAKQTVDLQYDARANVFLDAEKNVYKFEE